MSRETKMINEEEWIAKRKSFDDYSAQLSRDLLDLNDMFQGLEELLHESGEGGIGYSSQKNSLLDICDKMQALGDFITVLPPKMEEVDAEFCRKIQNGSTAKLSEIKLENFQTHKVGSLSTSYKDHRQTHSTQSINLTFKDFIGISGNENEYEEDTAWDDGKINDSYIRVFADMYKEQYEEEKKNGTADTLYEFLNGKMTAGEFIQKRQHNICLEVLQSVADLVPVVGQVKMLYEMASGKEMFTGDEMTYEEQRNNSLFFCLSLLAAPEAAASKALKLTGGTIEDIEKTVFKEALEKGTVDIDNTIDFAKDKVKKYIKDLKEKYKKITIDEFFNGGAYSYITKDIVKALQTEKDTAFFWSGCTVFDVDGNVITKADVIASEIAKSEGGVTLESTIADQSIDIPKWDFDNPDSIKAWEEASTAYAKQVSGDVRAIVGTNLRDGNIWENIELPMLMQNESVSKIITINFETMEQTIIFERDISGNITTTINDTLSKSEQWHEILENLSKDSKVNSITIIDSSNRSSIYYERR